MLAVLDELLDLIPRVDLTVHSEVLESDLTFYHNWAAGVYSTILLGFQWDSKLPAHIEALTIKLEPEPEQPEGHVG